MLKFLANNQSKTPQKLVILIWALSLFTACAGQEQFAALENIKNSEEDTLTILRTIKNPSHPGEFDASDDAVSATKPQLEDDKKTDKPSDAKTSKDGKPIHPYTYVSKKYPYPQYKMEPLAWESPKYPHRAHWSKFLQEIIVAEWPTLLEGTEDIKTFCPKFYELNVPQRANVWAQIFAVISKYESSFEPTTRMHEKNMGTDPVTKEPVYSEGLLQLSYQDARWARYCKFEWDADKELDPKDPNKTILCPFRNLYCGVGIMTNQVIRAKNIVLENGVYWAVIKQGGKFTKIPEIVKQVQEFKLCK